MQWRKLNGVPLDNNIYEVVKNTITEEAAKGHKLKVCIGTDSQVKQTYTEFATVIVFLRKGNGGFMYLHKSKKQITCSLKERMMLEVSQSIEVAYSLCELLSNNNIEMEVHADINADPNFASNKAYSDAMGYILGMGFTFKAKPEAFASSCCADRLVH